ncbi:YcaO-like family protein [Ancylobacter sp.]|uniref:YcaO-like family protein n=1 Tax=Ancylobacter sp. TaxID=1872567 RepID=UPI003BA968ED
MLSAAAELAEANARLLALRERGPDQGWPRSGRLERSQLEPFVGHLGITRVADLTDLDVLGIPVWSAIRPGSRSLCVSAGKGISHDVAWTSAVLESAEQALAEDAPALVSVVCSPRELARKGLLSVPLERQSRCAASWLPLDRELAWVKGLSWRTGEWVYAPYELVGMDMATEAPWNTQQFRVSSVGLASGADLESAITHGLSELVEDDAIFATLLPSEVHASPLDFDLERGRGLQALVERLAAHGLEAQFARAPTDLKLPVVLAALVSLGNQGETRNYFCGSACDTELESAALSALLEAVQCRGIFVSGARDDLYADDYRATLPTGTQGLFQACRFVTGADGYASRPNPSDVLTGVLDAAERDVYVFPLGGRRFGFDAVRVLADDLVSVHAPVGYARRGRAAGNLLRRWASS